MNTKQKQLLVRVPPEVHKQAKVLSAKTGRPLQQVLEELLREWIAKQEGLQAEQANH